MERKYENDQPIDDEAEALILMLPGRRCKKTLWNRKRGDVPHIEDASYCGGYTKEEYSGSRYYRVTPTLVERLRTKCLVEGTPKWGHTEEQELRLSGLGETAAWEHRKVQLRDALTYMLR